jgi:hypothetical protein
MFAVVVRHRFGRSRAPRAGINGHRWNARCLGHRDLSNTGDFLCDRTLLCRSRTENDPGAATEADSTTAVATNGMINDLPKAIAIYVEAENSGDVNLFDQCFTPDAVVSDENETHTGLAAIKKWKAETKRKYQHTVDPLKSVAKGGKFTVTNRLTGNFPGSPIELDFVFTLKNDKIAELEILS